MKKKKKCNSQIKINKIIIDLFVYFLFAVERLNKNIQCHYAMLYPDVAFLPASLNKGIKYQVPSNNEIDTFCIEIKPKQGWTFYGNDLTDVMTNKDLFIDNHVLNNNSNNNKCRFCSMQYLKVN